ncbi:type II toxin-antitoxin system prevent-host-death family antitoxin [Pseudonocardia sp. 73-21]|uniref:type II toxin-antitoxin system Phd/YefM family antitoxin n=1 Tax=Pseudonocardia sp. 73-21 TaxID=1895809 RepID=UPI003427E277
MSLQRELRSDNAEIMRRVEAGESFVVTRIGEPVADVTPHAATGKRRMTLGELQAADDLIFGDDRIGY